MNKFFIDVFDAAGNKLGEGPITSATGWQSTPRMDKAGSFGFQMPASDPKAASIAEKRRVVCMAIVGTEWTEIGNGIIDEIQTIPGGDGIVMLSVSGQDSVYELAGFSAGYASIANGSRAINVQSGLNILKNIAANTYGATWEFDYAGVTSNPDVYALLQGESLLAAVGNVAKVANYHFRSGGARTLTFFQGSAPSGIRAIRAQGDLAPETCAITNLRRSVETHDLFTRIVPFGAGQGHARLTLAPSTRETPLGYTVSKTALPTFIQKDDAVEAYGRIDRWVEFKEIGPIANTDLDVEAAANALFDYAKIHLDLYSQRATHYTLEVAQCSRVLLPGQSIRVDYRDSLSGLIIEEDLFILEATIRVNADGVQTTSLVVSDQDRWPIDDATVIGNALSEAKVYRSHPQLNANSYTTSYTKNIDDTETATIRFWFGNEVVQLQQVLLQFQLLQFESTVKAVGLESTSGGSGQLVTDAGGGGATSAPSNDTSGAPSTDTTGAATGNTGAATGNTSAPSTDTTGAAAGNTGPAGGSTGEPSNNTSGQPSNNTSSTPSTSDTGQAIGSTGAASGNTDTPNVDTSGSPSVSDTGAASGNTGQSSGNTGQSSGNTGGPSTSNSGGPLSPITGLPLNLTGSSSAGPTLAATGNTGAATGNTGAATGNTGAATGNTGESGDLETGSPEGGDTGIDGRHGHSGNVGNPVGASPLVPVYFQLIPGETGFGRLVVNEATGYTVQLIANSGGLHTHPVGTHTHSLASHSHSMNNHTHSLNGHTHDLGGHQHDLGGHTHSLGSHTHSMENHAHSLNNHTHSLNNHTHSLNNHTHSLNGHTHSLAGHRHSLANHTHGLNNHTHSLNGHTHTLNSHTHTLNNHTHGLGNHTHSLAAHTHTLGNHTHDMGNHTHTLNSHVHSLGNHTHSLNGHTHSLNDHQHTIEPEIVMTYGIFRQTLALTYAIGDLEFRVNGGDFSPLASAAQDMGGGWYRLDITSMVQSTTTYRPLQEANTLQIRRQQAAATGKTVTVDALLSVRSTIQAIQYSVN